MQELQGLSASSSTSFETGPIGINHVCSPDIVNLSALFGLIFGDFCKLHFAVVPAQEKVNPGGGARKGIVPGGDGGCHKGNLLRDPFHVVINFYPETSFFAGIEFAITLFAAAAGAIDSFFRAA